MKTEIKNTIIIGVILLMTTGTFVIKNYLMGNQSQSSFGSPLDLFLLIPTLPFLFFAKAFGMSFETSIPLMFVASTIFWLAFGYLLGKQIKK